jgi:hypothetical protein
MNTHHKNSATGARYAPDPRAAIKTQFTVDAENMTGRFDVQIALGF